jgi:hypothetical protein
LDYNQILQLYERIGQTKKCQDTPEYHSHKKELDRYDKLKSKRTGEFYQAKLRTSYSVNFYPNKLHMLTQKEKPPDKTRKFNLQDKDHRRF